MEALLDFINSLSSVQDVLAHDPVKNILDEKDVEVLLDFYKNSIDSKDFESDLLKLSVLERSKTPRPLMESMKKKLMVISSQAPIYRKVLKSLSEGLADYLPSIYKNPEGGWTELFSETARRDLEKAELALQSAEEANEIFEK